MQTDLLQVAADVINADIAFVITIKGTKISASLNGKYDKQQMSGQIAQAMIEILRQEAGDNIMEVSMPLAQFAYFFKDMPRDEK